MPIYPFLYVIAGATAAMLLRRGPALTALAALLLLWQVTTTLRVAPDYMAYGNEAMGRPASRSADTSAMPTSTGASNSKRSSSTFDQNHITNCWFAYFPDGAVQPQDYGIHCRRLPTPSSLWWLNLPMSVPPRIDGTVLISESDLDGVESGDGAVNPYNAFRQLKPTRHLAGRRLRLPGDHFPVPLASAWVDVHDSEPGLAPHRQTRPGTATRPAGSPPQPRVTPRTTPTRRCRSPPSSNGSRPLPTTSSRRSPSHTNGPISRRKNSARHHARPPNRPVASLIPRHPSTQRRISSPKRTCLTQAQGLASPHELPESRQHRPPGLPPLPRLHDLRQTSRRPGDRPRPPRLDPLRRRNRPLLQGRHRRRHQLLRHRQCLLLGRKRRGPRQLDRRQRPPASPSSSPPRFTASCAPGPNGSGLSRKAILFEVEASLRRLKTDFIDLYQIHRWDPHTPIEETMETLNRPRPAQEKSATSAPPPCTPGSS